MKVGIFIICYNAHNVFLKQMERINRHCKDDFEVIIIDNSTEQESIDAIKYFCDKIGIPYMKTNASSQNGSGSHAFAAQLSHTIYKNTYDAFFYLDHDCFPVKDFSVIEILTNYVMAGIGQPKSKTYMWPGCLMFNKGVDIDFSTNHELGLDTGGNTYKIIEQYPDRIRYFNEVHEQNPEFNKSFYNFYAMIHDNTFMHFVAGSNWGNKQHHEERINSLLNILEKK